MLYTPQGDYTVGYCAHQGHVVHFVLRSFVVMHTLIALCTLFHFVIVFILVLCLGLKFVTFVTTLGAVELLHVTWGLCTLYQHLNSLMFGLIASKVFQGIDKIVVRRRLEGWEQLLAYSFNAILCGRSAWMGVRSPDQIFLLEIQDFIKVPNSISV